MLNGFNSSVAYSRLKFNLKYVICFTNNGIVVNSVNFFKHIKTFYKFLFFQKKVNGIKYYYLDKHY